MYYLDHLVHFVDKPEDLIEKTKEIGLHTVMGGKHLSWGTYNSLCYFDLSYIEFIGIFDLELFNKAASEPFTLHETYKNSNFTNGVCRFALRTSTIEEDAKRFQQLGYDVYGPEEFSRTRPDGSLLKWKLLHFGNTKNVIDFPFLIQWEQEDEVRYKELMEKGIIKQHLNGASQLIEVIYEVENVSFIEEWSELFQYNIVKVGDQQSLIGSNVKFTFIPNRKTNCIKKVILSGVKETKEVELEGTTYCFCK